MKVVLAVHGSSSLENVEVEVVIILSFSFSFSDCLNEGYERLQVNIL